MQEKDRLKSHLVDIVDMMVKAGFDVTIYTTQAQADATRKVVEEGAGYDRIVCSGGDGTLDEVMTGLMQAKLHIPIGYIPAGSTNDFANSLGIPKEMLKAAERAVGQNRFPCDIGDFNSDTFVYVAAFGLFTEVSYKTSQQLKNIFGHVAYINGGCQTASGHFHRSVCRWNMTEKCFRMNLYTEWLPIPFLSGALRE